MAGDGAFTCVCPKTRCEWALDSTLPLRYTQERKRNKISAEIATLALQTRLKRQARTLTLVAPRYMFCHVLQRSGDNCEVDLSSSSSSDDLKGPMVIGIIILAALVGIVLITVLVLIATRGESTPEGE